MKKKERIGKMIPKNQRNRFWAPPENRPREHGLTVKRIKKILQENPDFFKNKIVLDAGCGWGKASRFIKSEGAKEVIAIDVNPDVIAQMERDKPTSFTFLKQNIYETEFKDNYFDIIVCTEVIEHMDTDELILCLKEWMRILKKNGYVWISTPKKRWEKKRYPNGNGSHWIEYDKDEVLKIFSMYGFVAEKVFAVNEMFFLFRTFDNL